MPETLIRCGIQARVSDGDADADTDEDADADAGAAQLHAARYGSLLRRRHTALRARRERREGLGC